MEILRVGIYADEAMEQERIKAEIQTGVKQLMGDVQLAIGLFSSSIDLIQASWKAAFHLVFIELHTPGSDGFQTAQFLNTLKIRPWIIFVSSHEELAFDSQEYRPLWFVRKHLMGQEVHRALAKFFELASIKKRKCMLKDGVKYQEVLSEDIIYIEYDSHKVIAKMREGLEYRFYGSLKSVEGQLPSREFIRTHRNYLVNLAYVGEVAKREVILLDGTAVPMGRDRRKIVREAMVLYEKKRFKIY